MLCLVESTPSEAPGLGVSSMAFVCETSPRQTPHPRITCIHGAALLLTAAVQPRVLCALRGQQSRAGCSITAQHVRSDDQGESIKRDARPARR